MAISPSANTVDAPGTGICSYFAGNATINKQPLHCDTGICRCSPSYGPVVLQYTGGDGYIT